MLTGLVYLIVIALWAVILVPRWLRRHDRGAELRSSMRFDRAMQTLNRRRYGRGVSSTSHTADITVVGARNRVHDSIRVDSSVPSPVDAHLDGGIDPFAGSVTEEQLRDARRRQTRSAAQAASAQRRKQVQQVLGGLSIVALILMLMGFVSPMMFILAPAALVGFTVLSQRQAKQATHTEKRLRRNEDHRSSARYAKATNIADQDAAPAREEREVRRSRRTASAGSASSSSSTGSSRSRRSGSTRQSSSRQNRQRRQVSQPSASLEMQELELGATGTEDVRIMSAQESRQYEARRNTDPGWSPVEAPLPRYVDSPRATNFPRNLDSTANGDWTSERMLEQVEALRTPGADAEYELGLDQFVDIPESARDTGEGYNYRRAVNG